jgi:hypothetical protein
VENYVNIKEAILNVLNGESVDSAIDDLVMERIVCRYQGAKQKRVTKRGKIYYVRKRVCQGRANPRLGRNVRLGMRRGGGRQQRSYAQKQRWRGALKRQNSLLPGELSRGPKKLRVRRGRRRIKRR